MAMDPGSIKLSVASVLLATHSIRIEIYAQLQKGCLQFVVIKPIFAIMSLIMYGLDRFENPWYQFLLQSVYNVSYTVAPYSLLLFYLATHNLLHEISPVFKFFAVKIVIFATYYQSLAVAAVPGVPHELSQRWNNFILCCEMSLFAVLHFVAFPAKEFSQGAMVTSFYSAFADAVNLQDVGRDLGTNFNSKYQNYASASGGAMVSPAIALSKKQNPSSDESMEASHPQMVVEDDISFQVSEDDFRKGIAARDEENSAKKEQQNHDAFKDQNAAAKKENPAEAKRDEDYDVTDSSEPV